jgi:hypothetical protein
MLRIKKVSSDGNCLLRAVALQCSSDHIELRRLLYDEYMNDPQEYQEFVDLPSYAEHIRSEGEWLDEIDIYALANITGAEIHLYKDNLRNLYNIYRSLYTPSDVIRIIYRYGNHYDAVIVQNEPAEPLVREKTEEFSIMEGAKKKRKKSMPQTSTGLYCVNCVAMGKTCPNCEFCGV